MLSPSDTAAPNVAADPIFAAIEKHRQAWVEVDRTPSDELDRFHEKDQVHPALEREWDTSVEFAETVPTTLRGLAAMVAYAQEVIEKKVDLNAFELNRRTGEKPVRPILETMAEAARALTADPSFAAVERHQRAEAAFNAAHKISDNTYETHRPEIDESRDAWFVLTRTTPTTLPGLLAMIAHLGAYTAELAELDMDICTHVDAGKLFVNMATAARTLAKVEA